MPVAAIARSASKDHADPLTADCLGREVFNHMTTRWGLLCLIALSNGPLRFHALRDHIEGVSEKMLSQSLKTLTRDGLILRSVEPTIPPQVTYALSMLGQEVAPSLQVLVAWLGGRIDDILRAQRAFDVGATA